MTVDHMALLCWVAAEGCDSSIWHNFLERLINMNTLKEQTHYWARFKGHKTAEVVLHTTLGVFYRIGQAFGVGYDQIDWISDDSIPTVNPPPQIVDGAYYVIDSISGKVVAQCQINSCGLGHTRFYKDNRYWELNQVNVIAGPMTPEEIVKMYYNSKCGDH